MTYSTNLGKVKLRQTSQFWAPNWIGLHSRLISHGCVYLSFVNFYCRGYRFLYFPTHTQSLCLVYFPCILGIAAVPRYAFCQFRRSPGARPASHQHLISVATVGAPFLRHSRILRRCTRYLQPQRHYRFSHPHPRSAPFSMCPPNTVPRFVFIILVNYWIPLAWCRLYQRTYSKREVELILLTANV